VRPSSDVLGVSALIFWLEENCDAKLLRAWQKTNGVTSQGKQKYAVTAITCRHDLKKNNACKTSAGRERHFNGKTLRTRTLS
jgi:hypothetical protein